MINGEHTGAKRNGVHTGLGKQTKNGVYPGVGTQNNSVHTGVGTLTETVTTQVWIR